jgi:dTDP-4-dehydrorhamnose reductase
MLVTGAGGQLGRAVVDAASGHDVVAADSATLDVRDRDAVMQAFGATRPHVAVHAAAWTAVDDCELDLDRAYAVNALGARHVADAAASVGAHVVYVSTDYVFDGCLDRPYHEWDEPHPRSVYAASKLAGEREIGPGATIVRSAWLFAPWGTNMVRTALRLAAGRPVLRFVDDQRGSPTSVLDLAPALVRLAVARMPGLYHVTNQGGATWFELVCEVLRAAGHDPARVEPIATVDLDPPRAAPRPANSVLDNAVLRLEGEPLLPDWHDAVARTVRLLHA